MTTEIQPTIQNSRILTEYLQTKINTAIREKYPTAENLIDNLINGS